MLTCFVSIVSIAFIVFLQRAENFRRPDWILFTFYHLCECCSVIIIIIPIIFIISNIPPAGSEAERHRWNMTLITVATIYWHFSTFSWQQLLPAANNRSAYPEHQSSGLARLRSSGVTALLSTRRLNEKNNSWELTKLAIKHCSCCKNDSTLTFLSSKALYCGPLWSTVVHCGLSYQPIKSKSNLSNPNLY